MIPQVIMAGSMVLLYLISIGVVVVFGKKSRTRRSERLSRTLRLQPQRLSLTCRR